MITTQRSVFFLSVNNNNQHCHKWNSRTRMQARGIVFVFVLVILCALLFAWSSSMFPGDIPLPQHIILRISGDKTLALDDSLSNAQESASSLLRKGIQDSFDTIPQLQNQTRLKDFIMKQQEQFATKFKDKLSKLGKEVEEQMKQFKFGLEFPYGHINDPSSPHLLTVILPYRNREKNLEKTG